MFLMADSILVNTINSRLNDIKQDATILDRLFSQVDPTLRDQMKNYLASNQIYVCKGYPMNHSFLPAYAVILGSEQEEPEALGGALGGDEANYTIQTFTETLTIENLNTLVGFQTTNKPVQSLLNVTYNGANHTADAVILDETKGTVYFGTPDMLGKTVSVTYTALVSGYELYGTLLSSQYRIETWATNGDLASLLYHLLKWMILSSRDDLDAQGLKNQRISGTDLEPIETRYPEPIYRRALILSASSEARWDKAFNFINRIVVD